MTHTINFNHVRHSTFSWNLIKCIIRLELPLVLLCVHLSCFFILPVHGRVMGIPTLSRNELQDDEQEHRKEYENMKFSHRKLIQADNEKRGIKNQYIVVFNKNFTSTNRNNTITITSLIKEKITEIFNNANQHNLMNNFRSNFTDDNNSTSTIKDWIVEVLFRDDVNDKNQSDNANRQRNMADSVNVKDSNDSNSDSIFVRILHIFQGVSFQGFVVSNVRYPKLLEFILEDYDVAYIEQDSQVQLEQPVSSIQDTGIVSSEEVIVPWGLDRIDQTSLPLDHRPFVDNVYNGSGVMVYIIDSGILATHEELNGRIVCGPNFLSGNSKTAGCDDGTGDGHATHVAGIVGGKTFGVAKATTFVSIKVLDASGNGYMSNVIAAIQYVINQKMKNPSKPVILNMSLGGSINDSLNYVLETAAKDYSIHVIVSAGNNYGNSCFQSPAQSDYALAVAATNANDGMAWYSNWGKCVDILAPGTDIMSAWNTDNSATRILSGTSMAAPFVAGAAALYLQQNTSLSPSDLRAALQRDSVRRKIMVPIWAIFSTPNLLLNVNAVNTVQS